jgi:hypothetical protein
MWQCRRRARQIPHGHEQQPLDRGMVVKTKLGSMVLICAIAAVAVPVCAQQPSDAEKTPPAAQAQNSTAPSNASSASNASSDADDAAATAALIAKANAAAAKAASSASTKATSDVSVAKKAREAGWRPESHNGETVYCRDDPQIGSRFATRRCVQENQLLVLLEQAQYQKDMLKNGSCNGAACNAGK